MHCGLDWPNIRPDSQRPMWIKDFWEHLLLIFWKYQPGKNSFLIPTTNNMFLVFAMLNNFSSWRCLFQHLRWLLTNAYWVKHPAPSRCPIISTTTPATSLHLTLLAIMQYTSQHITFQKCCFKIEIQLPKHPTSGLNIFQLWMPPVSLGSFPPEKFEYCLSQG